MSLIVFKTKRVNRSIMVRDIQTEVPVIQNSEQCRASTNEKGEIKNMPLEGYVYNFDVFKDANVALAIPSKTTIRFIIFSTS